MERASKVFTAALTFAKDLHLDLFQTAFSTKVSVAAKLVETWVCATFWRVAPADGMRNVSRYNLTQLLQLDAAD